MSRDHLNFCTFCYSISPCILFALATTCRCANSISNADQRTKLFLNLWIHCSSKIELSKKKKAVSCHERYQSRWIMGIKGLVYRFFTGLWWNGDYYAFKTADHRCALCFCISELAILWCRASIMASATDNTQALKSLFIKAALNFAFACLWLYFQLPYYPAELFPTLGDKIESLSVHST